MFGEQVIQAGFSGLGAFGAGSQAVLRGATVDVSLEINFANRVVAYTSNLTRSLISRLNSSGFHVVNLDDSALNSVTGGTIRARVQILTDGYASARDAASVVAGAASALGYNVVGFAGTLVSSGAAATLPGSTQSGQQFDPSTVPSVSGAETGGGLQDFISSLTKSPTTLAVIAGAAVLLVIAAKK